MAKRFVLTIDMENDAFRDRGEIPRILRELADRVKRNQALLPGGSYAIIRDVNGNKVGCWEIVEV